jgi:hypothetical protein
MLPHLRVSGLPPTSQMMPLLTIGVSTELGSALPRQSPDAPGVPVARFGYQKAEPALA